MKCDIVRVWKDEHYRQSLSAEQLHMLPANPVGELTDADLATISGTGGFEGAGSPGIGGVGGPGGFGGGTPSFGLFRANQSDSLQARENFESLAHTCENNCYTCNWVNVDYFSITNTLSPATQICANTH